MNLSEDPSEFGQQFFYGDGRKKSYRNAFPYLLKAARAGDPHCQNLVGYSYDLGLGVERNIQLALFWYEQAAKNNDREGLFNLALLYREKRRGQGDYGKRSLCTSAAPKWAMRALNVI